MSAEISENKTESKSFIKATSFSDALDTGVYFPSVKSWKLAQETSSKSINPTTYDRMEKYHSPYDNNSLVARIFNTVFDKIKPLMRKLYLYND